MTTGPAVGGGPAIGGPVTGGAGPVAGGGTGTWGRDSRTGFNRRGRVGPGGRADGLGVVGPASGGRSRASGPSESGGSGGRVDVVTSSVVVGRDLVVVGRRLVVVGRRLVVVGRGLVVVGRRLAVVGGAVVG
ncbi:MAG: hypothetical protein ACT4OS_06695, partial [Acidimicrobiales bacterium]